MSSQQQQHQLPATATASDTTNRYITSTDRPHSPSTNSNPNQTVKISLEPLTESVYFDTKVLTFSPGQEIRIGRVSGSRNQREAKTDNGVFVCDVMSREHALLKEINGRICIKDLRSTHGTFVNNERVQEEPRYLKHADIITFGHSVRRNQTRVAYPPQEGNQQIPPPQPLQGVKRDNANGSDNSHVRTHETDQATKASKKLFVIKHSTDSKGDKEKTTNIKLNITSDRAKEKSPEPSGVHHNVLQIPPLSPDGSDGKEPEKPIEETRIECLEDQADAHDLSSESEPPAPQKSDVAVGKSSGETNEVAEASKHISTPHPYASIPVPSYSSSYHTTASRVENIPQQKSPLTLDVDTTFGVSPSVTSKITSAASSSKHVQTTAQIDEQPVKKVKRGGTSKGKSRSVKGKKEVKVLPTSKTRTSVGATTTPESQDKIVTPEQSPTLPSPVLTPVTAYSSNSNSFPPPALTPASSTLISMTVPPKSTSKSTQASSSGKRSHSEVEQDVQVLQDKLEDVERRVKRAKVVDLGMAVMGAVTAFIGAGLGVTYWGGQ
ncbi:2202_t:CDS:2 [Paraglomus brasilianum]|uniref:2202_t:CDS:1 n=1 Tax=Paraglomus brasilianum TaxID=144538 RepID=A0A9N9GRV0_9GLOM|nr:2202_t:CDS:2 [Paraglomus brasilianum]